MKRFWAFFFMFWPVVAIILCWVSPRYGWWFPGSLGAQSAKDYAADSLLGQEIDGLFYMILYITTIVFIGTQIALGYVLWTGSRNPEDDVDETGAPRKAWYSHGSHSLEVMWTIVPAGILLFIALYQMNVWAEFRIEEHFPEEKMMSVLNKIGLNPIVEFEVPVTPAPAIHGEGHAADHNATSPAGPPKTEKRTIKRLAIAEVTARQFEWRIRYPGFDQEGNLLPLMPEPQPTDLYTVNDLHLPSGGPVMFELRSEDVQHSFFVPELRVKQDAVPGLVIPIWFESPASKSYALTCAELCGWGHYKMRAQVVTQRPVDFLAYLKQLHEEQSDDGFIEEEPEE